MRKSERRRIEIANSYRKLAQPAHPGQLRVKTWAMPVFLDERDAYSPLWERRCREYWERQERLYGLEFHANFTNMVEPPDPRTGKPAYITTCAVVKRVLPGTRIDFQSLRSAS